MNDDIAIFEPFIQEIKDMGKLDLTRQVAFHAICGKLMRELLAKLPDGCLETKYPLFAFDVVCCNASVTNKSNLGIDCEVAMSSVLDFMYNASEKVNPLTGDIGEIYSNLQRTSCLIYQAARIIGMSDTGMADKLTSNLDINTAGQSYGSSALTDIVDFMNYQYDKFLQEQEMLSTFGDNFEQSSMCSVQEAHLWGADPECECSIVTKLFFRPMIFEPKNPGTYYKGAIRKILKQASEMQLGHDDLVAIDWCIRDWKGYASHLIDSGKGRNAIFILEALLLEYESAFRQEHMSVLLDDEFGLLTAVRNDLGAVRDMYLENLSHYTAKDVALAVKRFKRLDKGSSILKLVDVQQILAVLIPISNRA